MDELLEYIARNLVIRREAVRVERSERGRLTVFQLLVHSSDMGRIIGRQGRMASAIRTIMRAAPIGKGRRCVLDIAERT